MRLRRHSRRADARRAGSGHPHERLEDAIGVRFDDTALLERALTHRSYCAEHAGTLSNERLEFLGDAVLGLVVTDYVFTEFELFPEGDLSKLRAGVVNQEVLAEVGSEAGVGEALRLGKGEEVTGRTKPSILGDAVEALIGAVYLDAGWDAARALVLRLFETRIVAGAAGPGAHDAKSRVNELVTRRYGQGPQYRVKRSGPDHAPSFTATVIVRGEEVGRGEGGSKRQSEQAAARAAWRRLQRVDAAGEPEEGRDAGAA